MSTHGCLVIRARGEQRSLLLHTYQAGRDIPEWVARAPGFRITDRFAFLLEDDFSGNRNRLLSDPAELSGYFHSQAASDGVSWPPSVASWIIAATPCTLEPTPENFVCDLPAWSGIDDPFELEVSEEEWRLTREGELILTLDPVAVMLEALRALVSG